MNMPTISVVVPTYNYGPFVCEAVKSVLVQTQSLLEIIVVDDGSQDDTAALLEQFGDSIRYVYQENRGLSAARNTGIGEARGEWIAFLDSDDLWHPRKIERISHAISVHPELCAIGSDMVLFSDKPPDPRQIDGDCMRFRHIGLRSLVYGEHFSGGSGAVVKKSCFDVVGGFDEKLRAVEDLDMWVRLASKFPMARLREPLVFVRVHPTSMSAKAESMEANHRLMIEKTFSSNPLLKHRAYWKRVATARMHRGVAIMYAEAGNYREALLSTVRSLGVCPLTSGHPSPLVRLRMILHFLVEQARNDRSTESIDGKSNQLSRLNMAVALSERRAPASISIIVPAYNVAQTVAQTLDSIVRQTLLSQGLGHEHIAVEIIIGDDASTDGTIQCVESWLAQNGFASQAPEGGPRTWSLKEGVPHPVRACLLEGRVNRGGAAVRNECCRAATGDWLAFVDADDCWVPWKLAVQLAHTEKYPNVDLWCSNAVDWLPQRCDLPCALGELKEPVSPPDITSITLDSMCVSNPVASSTVMVRRDAVLEAKGFSEQYRGPEDYDLWLRLATCRRLMRIETPLCFYRQLPNSLSMDDRDFLPAVLHMLEDHFSPGGILADRRQHRKASYSVQHYSAAWMAFCRKARAMALHYWWISLRYDPLCRQRALARRLRFFVRILFSAPPA